MSVATRFFRLLCNKAHWDLISPYNSIIPVHVSHKYLRNLPNEKKGKRNPSHCLFSVLAFFKS
ncbi:hypothetical protein [Wolbachia endosymbiont (group A) of Agelastica alni]|uniref:hypothetical protein n=1 Tax=Wolbachia endosymbiont (group A) of Agelastica alni TaxID=3066130 RepID=UPI003132BBBB